MISTFFTKGFFAFCFCLTLISIPPSVSIYETRMENDKLEKEYHVHELEFEQNAKRLHNATYSEGISQTY